MGIEHINQPPEIIYHLEMVLLERFGFTLFSGKNGTGKSFAAMQIYEYFTPYKLPEHAWEFAIFITQSELNQRWLKESKTGDTSYLLEQMQKTNFLVLDDIGTRTPSEAFMDFLYEIVDKRYTNRKNCVTFITTNLRATDMREKFGDAFLSRVSSGKCFRFEGEDRRAKEF